VDVTALVPHGLLSGADFGNGTGPLQLDRPDAAVTVLTFASAVTRELQQLMRGLDRAGYAYRVLGIGHYFSWAHRLQEYRDTARAVAAARGEGHWLLVVDAYDSVPLRPEHELATALATAGLLVGVPLPQGAVLVGADALCWSNCVPLGDAWWAAKGVAPPPLFRNPDAGNLLGRAGDVAALYAWELERYPDDDQVALGLFLREQPAGGTPDHARAVFANIALGALPQRSEAMLAGTMAAAQGAGDAAPFFAHFPYQKGESGVNRVLRDLVAHVAAQPTVQSRGAAARAVAAAWPSIRARLEHAHAVRDAWRCASLVLGIVLCVASAASLVLSIACTCGCSGCLRAACLAQACRAGYTPVSTKDSAQGDGAV